VFDHRRRADTADLLVAAEAELQRRATPRRLASTAAQMASASKPFMSQAAPVQPAVLLGQVNGSVCQS
jgi:hypothetical protein